MVIKEIKFSNGTKMKLEETPYYYKVTVGDKVWYWERETGKFDGMSWQIVTKCAKKAGLPNLVNPESGKVHHVSPHRLRDAFAVNAVKKDDSGDGLRMLQEHLGHQAISTTMRYRKVAGEEHKDWYNRLFPQEDKADGSTA